MVTSSEAIRRVLFQLRLVATGTFGGALLTARLEVATVWGIQQVERVTRNTIHGEKKRLYGIPGNPLNLLDTPDGCYFQARCEQCTAECTRGDKPELKEYAPGRMAACHHIELNQTEGAAA